MNAESNCEVILFVYHVGLRLQKSITVIGQGPPLR